VISKHNKIIYGWIQRKECYNFYHKNFEIINNNNKEWESIKNYDIFFKFSYKVTKYIKDYATFIWNIFFICLTVLTIFNQNQIACRDYFNPKTSKRKRKICVFYFKLLYIYNIFKAHQNRERHLRHFPSKKIHYIFYKIQK